MVTKTARPEGGSDIGAGVDQGQSDGASAASLKDNNLLRCLPPDALARVEESCRWRQLETNDVVFDQDDSSRDVFFIVRGRLRILVFRGPSEDDDAEEAPPGSPGGAAAGRPPTDPGAESAADSVAETDSIRAGLLAFEALVDEGAPMTLTELGAGDTFGELSAIDGRMRSARAVALEPSLVAIMEGEAFVDLVKAHGDLAIALLQRVAGYLRTSNRRMYNLSTLTAKQRVYAQLARLSEINPSARMEWIIDPLPSHADIAFWAGTKRETVAAAIGWLAREGVVSRQHRALLVRDPARLKALAHV
ncbi:Crp/Fnr family transcriptional regulator [uncultured Rhodospira sp.]|uniref:Crp/Fnr family transcriptional regulator n=1 Tax=uncultured Rhodospira sp. TaxID=1936189 RepID=UPI002609BF06|nr:Crp/Fnr family transcriptional regulator [uncultured Rhodospira sp.]